MDEQQKHPGEGHEATHWTDDLDGRTRVHIAYARVYASDYAHGAPGHLDLMTIAALAEMLDKATVRTTAALAPNASINDAIGAVEDIAELVGWPCIDSNRSEDDFVMTFKRGGL